MRLASPSTSAFAARRVNEMLEMSVPQSRVSRRQPEALTPGGTFRVKTSRHQNVARRKRHLERRRDKVARRRRRIERRLRPRTWHAQSMPMYRASNVQYEHSDRVRGLASGGIGAMHRLAQSTGLVAALDQHVEVLKVHLPYHESDHVLGIAYNVLCGGTCLQDIEQRRQDEVYLDALGAQRIPDPTTAGDFCRRFDEAAIEALQAAINETRVRVWRAQPPAFFDEAVIDADGTLAETTGACKEGMDISYEGVWGYHPLVVSLANTQEPLYLINRSGNRPSSEGAAERFEQACTLCRTAGFRRITFRGDTDFSQTEHLDRWDADGVRFVFGYDARANLIREADALPTRAWTRLVRRPAYEVHTEPRQRPANVKEAIIGDQESAPQRGSGRRVSLPTGRMCAAIPDGRRAEEYLSRTRRPAAVRRDSLLLLSHQRSRDRGSRRRLPGQ
jgi:Transposase DDE domain group 1